MCSLFKDVNGDDGRILHLRVKHVVVKLLLVDKIRWKIYLEYINIIFDIFERNSLTEETRF